MYAIKKFCKFCMNIANILAITAHWFRMHEFAPKNTFKADRSLYDLEILHISLYYANLEDLYDNAQTMTSRLFAEI